MCFSMIKRYLAKKGIMFPFLGCVLVSFFFYEPVAYFGEKQDGTVGRLNNA